MNEDPYKNEFDDLVRRAKGYFVRPLTPGEKAGVLWADAELTRLREALDKSYSFDVFNNVVEANGIFREKLMAVGYNPRELLEEAELRRRAKEG